MQNAINGKTQTSANTDLGFQILIGFIFFEVFASILLFSQPAARTDSTIVSLLIVGVLAMGGLLAFSYAFYSMMYRKT